MVKNTQTIRLLFECLWPFCGFGAQKVDKPQTEVKH